MYAELDKNTHQFLSILENVFFPFENSKMLLKNFKKLVLDIQNVRHIAQNAGYTAQNDGRSWRPRITLL